MTCNEFTANLQLAASAQRAHVSAHFAKPGTARHRAPEGSNWQRIAFAVAVAAPVLASVIIRFG